MSVFYDLQIAGKPGMSTTNGGQIVSLEPEVTVDGSGFVAFAATLDDSGPALLFRPVGSRPFRISDDLTVQYRGFNQLQLRDDDHLVAIETEAGVGVAVRSWNTFEDLPPRTIVERGDLTSSGVIGDILAVSTANDGETIVVSSTSVAAELTTRNDTPTATLASIGPAFGTARPMLATDQRFVFLDGVDDQGDLVVMQPDGTGGYSSISLASTGLSSGERFDWIGPAPGISDDGTVIAFVGDRGQGPGVFLAVDDGNGNFGPLVVVAGERNGPSRFEPGLGYDAAGVAIEFADFDRMQRVGVARLGSDAEIQANTDSYFMDRYVVTFVATPTSASVPNLRASSRPLLFTAEQGVWTVPVFVDFEIAGNDYVYHPQSPLPVAQVGDALDGGIITGFTLHDPVSALTRGAPLPNYRRGDHVVAFRATTTDGDRVVVARHEDLDGDGLLNHWELQGIDIDQDGRIDLNLPALGAQSSRQDIFLEFDWLADQPDARFEPAPGVTKNLVDLFAAAPVANPDGTSGITLHFDAGRGFDAAGGDYSQNIPTPSLLQGGEQIGQPFAPTDPIDVVYMGPDGSFSSDQVSSRSFESIKRTNFGVNDKNARELAFHYFVLANFIGAQTNLLGSVISATIDSATADTVSLNLPTILADDKRGHAIKVIDGAAAGQIRTIASHSLTEITVSQDWDIVPTEDSTIVFLYGNGGEAEVAFAPTPDYHALPGNDGLLALRGYGLNAIADEHEIYFLLSNAFVQTRVLAHELGHQLGLRHCGTDPDADACINSPESYLSLMSYAHSVSRTSSVTTFSNETAPLFNDWLNLRLDFQSNFSALGYTSRLPDSGDSDLTVQNYLDTNGGIGPDYVSPATVLSWTDGDKVSKNQNLTLQIVASDDRAISAVFVSLDLDGDGDVEPDETVLADDLGSGNYSVTLGPITGPLGDRELVAAAYDSSGNVAFDFGVVDVSHDFPSLVGAIAQLGPNLQNALPDLPEEAQFPFVTNSLADVVDLTDTFSRLANRLYDDSGVSGTPVPSPVLANDASLVLNVGGTRVVPVTIPAASTTDNDDVEDLVADVNQSLAAAGLADVVVASQDAGALRLVAVNDGTVTSLSTATIRLAARNAPVSFGQPSGTLSVGFDVERADGTTSIALELASGVTQDNVDATDLVSDLNDALVELGQNDVLFVLETSGRLALAAIDPTIVSLTPVELASGDLAELGFAANQIGAPKTTADFPELGLEGLHDVADLRFDSFESFGLVLVEQLAELSGVPLPVDFDPNVVYDEANDTVFFTLLVERTFERSVALDLVDAGLDLGPLGTIELAAIADGVFAVDLRFEFRVGVFLGGLGGDFLLDDATPLSTLQGGAGVQTLVGTTAVAPAPSDGQLSANSTFQIRLVHEDPVDDSFHFITVAQHPSTADPTAPSTEDNFDVASLASDLNLALEAQGLRSQVEFVVYRRGSGGATNDYLALRAVAVPPTDISPLRDLELLGAEELGFLPSQLSDYADLRFALGAAPATGDLDCGDGVCLIDVSLAGSRTIEDVVERIESATAGAVTVDLNWDGSGLELTAAGPLSVEQGFAITDSDGTTDQVIRSLAGIGLGVLSSAEPAGDVSGDELHGQTLADRIFLVEDSAHLPMSFTARLAGSLDVSAAFGNLLFTLTTPTPFQLTSSASVQLVDPNGDDQRVTIPEMIADPGSILTIELDSLVPTASGSLVAFPAIAQPWYAEDATTTSSPLFELAFSASVADGFSISADVDFQNVFASFGQMSVLQVLDQIANFAHRLNDETTYPWINTELPLVDRSLSDLLGFVDALQSSLQCLPDVGDEVLLATVGGVETAITNLSLPLEDRDRLVRMHQLLLAVVSPPEDPSQLAEYSDRFPARLLSAAAQIRRITGQDVPAGTAGLEELLDAITAVDNLFCTWDTIELRLETQLGGALRELVGDAIQVQVDFDLVEDLDGVETTHDRAIAAGVILSGTVSEEFSPQFPIPESLGPIEFEVAPELTLVAGFSAALGMAFPLDQVAAPLMIVAPPPDQPELVATRIEATIGFDSQLDSSIRIGSLDLVAASGNVTLSDAQRDRDLRATGLGVVTLTQPVLDDNELLTIVTVNGVRRDPSEFILAGTSLAFTQNLPATTDVIDVTYLSTTNPGSPLDLVADSEQRAGLDLTFAPETPITSNTIGAIPLDDFPSNLTATPHGLITSSLDVEFLGSTVDDAIALAVSFADIDQPQLVVDDTALLSLFTNLDFDLKSILAGLEALLGVIETGLTSDVMASLPVVGDGLDMAGTFAGTLRTEFVAPFNDFLDEYQGTLDETRDAVQRKIFEFLGPGLSAARDPLGVGIPRGAELLADRDGDNDIDLSDVEVTLDGDHFEIGVTIGGRDELTTGFNLGLGGFPLQADVQGGVTLGLGYRIDLAFGVDRIAGAYFLTNEQNYLSRPSAEMAFEIDASLAVDQAGPDPVPTALDVRLFGLPLTITDVLKSNGKSGTFVSGELSLDLQDLAGTGRVALRDLTHTPFAELFVPELAADVEAHLRLSTGLGSSLPQLQTDLVASWSAGLSTANGGLQPRFEQFQFGLENSGLNLNDFLGRQVGVFLDGIKKYLEPIEPVIRLLRQEVPGVTQMSEAAGKGQVTFLDLALAKHPEVAASANQFVAALDTIARLADSVETLENGQTLFAMMDDLPLGSDGPAADSTDFGSTLDVDDAVADAGGQSGDPRESAGESRSIIQQLEDIGIHLYFLDIANDVRMLMGQSFDVIGVELPTFTLPIEFQAKFPVWPAPPINVRLGLNAEFAADLSVGFDGYGLQTGNFFDGFYFGDREDVFVGPDIEEFRLSVGVSLAALLDVLVASAGVEGEIRADILANWRDLDSDGKVRLDEIESVLQNDGLSCLFDLSGQFRAIVRIVWEVLGAEGSHEFIDQLLFSFQNQCPTYQLGHVSEGSEALPGGPDPRSSPGTLILHAGAFADQRGPGRSSDTHEAFTVTALAPGVYQVEGMGLTSRYAGVERIFFDGGIGNDTLTLVNVAIPVTALGGVGDDELEGGLLGDYLDGGDGNDDLSGRGGTDTLHGGRGDDTLLGEGGRDDLFGDDGNDHLDGGTGDDHIEGGGGDDQIFGDAGADTVDAGAGLDFVYGGPDADTLDGGPDSDFVLGDAGDDTLRGGSSSDFLSGGWDNDTLFGESGNDLLVGGLPNATSEQQQLAIEMFALDANFFAQLDPGTGVEGNDSLWGGIDNDLLIGDLGADQLFGGWGNDQLLAFQILVRTTTDSEYLEGGPGDDLICGASGDDTIVGGTSDLGLADILAQAGGAGAGGFESVSCDASPRHARAARGSISGVSFNDQDRDQIRDPSEAGLAGQTIQLFDDQGMLVASAVTNESGNYEFSSLEPGAYEVRFSAAQGTGYLQTSPTGGGYTIQLEPSQQVAGQDFGVVFAGAIVRGQKFHDLNGDGFHDSDEPGLNHWTIRLLDAQGHVLASTLTADWDRDANGVIDPTTERGWYAFEDLPEGQYEIVESSRPGWIETWPRLAQATDVYLPLADDGFSTTQSDAFITGLSIPLEEVVVTLSLEHPAIGELDAWLIGPDGTRVDLFRNAGGDADDLLQVRFDDGANRAFAEITAASSPSGAYRPVESLAAFAGLSANGSWTLVVRDDSRGQAGRMLDWSLRLNTEGGRRTTIHGGLPSVFTPENNVRYELEVAPGDKLEGFDFGNFQTATAESRKFWETSVDVPDRQEPGVAGVTIFADLNDNGQYDRREPATITQADDPDTLVRETGLYVLTNLPPGDYYLREVTPERSTLVYPPAPLAAPGHHVTPRSGQLLRDHDFGNASAGAISGTKWFDLNGNGRRDLNEPGLAGVTVYVDLNGNGQFDTHEPSAITADDNPATPADETGNYLIEGLDAGLFTLREVVPAGMTQTAGGRQIVYATGFEQTPVDPEWSTNRVAIAPADRRQFLGPFDNQTVTLELENLVQHDELIVSFDLLIIGSWDGAHRTLGGDSWRLVERGGVTLIETTFSNATDDTPSFHNPIDPLDVDDDGFIVPLDALRLINSLNEVGSRLLAISEWFAGVTFFDPSADGFLSPLDALLIINHLNEIGPSRSTARVSGPLFPQTYVGQLFDPFEPLEDVTQGVRFVGAPPVDLADVAPRTGAAESNTLGFDRFNLPSTHVLARPMDAVYRLSLRIPHQANHITLDFSALGLRNDGQFNFEQWGIDNVVVSVPRDFHTVFVGLGDQVAGVDFGNAPTGTVEGLVWDDGNANERRDLSEPERVGATVYWDANRNRQLDAGEPFTLTQADLPGTGANEAGTFQLAGVAAGRQSIRVVPLAAEVASYPATGTQRVTVVANSTLGGVDFGLAPLSGPQPAQDPFADGEAGINTATGVVWNDFDADGVRDPDEAGMSLVLIFADLDNDGDFDADEPWTETEFDDSNTPADERGTYELTSLPFGAVVLRQLPPTGTRLTFPSAGFHVVEFLDGETHANLDFGNHYFGEVFGVKWHDLDEDGQRDDTEPGLAGVVIYADLNNNARLDAGEPFTETLADDPLTVEDETGSYYLTDLPTGDITIREVVPFGYAPTYPEQGVYHVALIPPEALLILDFGNVLGSVIEGLKWNDLNADGDRELGEPGVAGVTIYIDVNDNGQFDEGEPSTITQSDDPNTPDDETGRYALGGLDAGQYQVREVTPRGAIQTHPTLGVHHVSVGNQQIVSFIDFGNLMPGAARGSKWSDLDGDGRRDSNEPGLAGVVIYADTNFDGNFDPGEPWTLTRPDDPTTPADETGEFELPLPPNDASIREVVPSGYRRTRPEEGYTISVTSEESVGGLDFGNQPIADLAGVKWDDLDANGVRDEGEPGLAGVTIYVDLNGNRRLDSKEPSAVTLADDPKTPADEAGTYSINDVPAGHQTVREISPPGYAPSYPEFGVYQLELEAGDKREDLDFGNYLALVLEDGDDLVFAGAGHDLVHGDNTVTDPRLISVGTRRDTLHGEAGPDELFGQERDDQLWGEEDADDLDGGLGDDWVFQTVDADQTLTDSLLTGQGPDRLLNNSVEHAALTGRGGDNRLDASGFTLGGVTLDGGAGSDTLIGSARGDELRGGSGSDHLQGGGGPDTLDGGAGSDQLEGQTGDDVYWFASATQAETDTVSESLALAGGVDTLDFSSLALSEPVIVDLTAGTGSHGARQLVFVHVDAIENVLGGAGPDQLTGSAADNLLVGNAGRDTLVGMDGADTLDGGADSDDYDGGPGDDRYVFSEAWGNTESLVDISGDDTLDFTAVTASMTVIIGSPALDQLDISAGAAARLSAANSIEHLLTGAGDDRFLFAADLASLAGGLGDLDAGAGINELDYSPRTSAAPVNVDLGLGTATGTAGIVGIVNVTGGAGNDTLIGDSRDNTLSGRAGDDTLDGAAGDDSLQGGFGDDTLRGRLGKDRYQFGPGQAGELDTVSELANQGNDLLDFSDSDQRVVVELNSSTLVAGTASNRAIQVETVGQNAFFEEVVGSAFNDEFIVNSGALILAGGRGDDVYTIPPDADGTVTLREESDAGADEINFQPLTLDVEFDLALAQNKISTGANSSMLILLESSSSSSSVAFEDLRGGAGNDSLLGNDGHNLLRGGAGNDKLVGRRGNDVLSGGAGINTLSGDSGDDTYRFLDQVNATEDLVVEDEGTFAAGFVSPGGVDTLDFSRLTTSVIVDLTVRDQFVGAIIVRLQDSSGASAPRWIENVLGSATAPNQITGNSNDNLLAGGAADDTLDGRAGADTLLGNGGADTLFGGQDRDLLVGGAGGDTLSGEQDEDILIGGATQYDTLPVLLPASLSPFAAWDALRRGWISASFGYADRIDRLMSGLAASSDPPVVAKLDEGTTVFDDLDADSLSGDAARDWFFSDVADSIAPDPGGRPERVE